MIRAEQIAVRFGATEAVRGVSLEVEKGEILGFVGPNGAGKTTTLRVLTGVLAPDSGTVTIDGLPLGERRLEAQRRIGYLPEGAPLHLDMRVVEELRYRGRLLGIPRLELGAAVDRAVELAQLGEVRTRLIGTLSRGFRQRVGLAYALIGDPPILILDEPTTGLDPVQRRDFLRTLAELARDRTVILSSHVLPEVDAVADRFAVLIAGTIAAAGTSDELLERTGCPDLEAAFVHLAEGGGGAS